MNRSLWQISALSIVAFAAWMSVRDLVGFGDRDPAGSMLYTGQWHLWGFVHLVSLVVAASLVLRSGDRPSSRMLATALIGLSLNNNWWFYSLNNPLIWPSALLNYAGTGVGLAQFVRFASTYGSVDTFSIRRFIGWLGPPVGAATAVFGLQWFFSVMNLTPNGTYNQYFWYGCVLADLLAILAVTVGSALARNTPERMRMLLLASSFGVAAAGTILHGVVRLKYGDLAWANYVDAISQLALPIGLGYAILRHRLLDREFVVRSAFVNATFTVLLSAGEVMIDRVKSLVVPDQDQTAAGVANFALSVIVVFYYKSFEEWTDHLFDRWTHSDDRERCERLQTFAHTDLVTIEDPHVLEDRLLRAIERAANVRAIALYSASASGSFERISSTIQSLPQAFDAMPELGGSFVTFPMRSPRRLDGFVVCDFQDAPRAELFDTIGDTVQAAGQVLMELRLERLSNRVAQLEADTSSEVLTAQHESTERVEARRTSSLRRGRRSGTRHRRS